MEQLVWHTESRKVADLVGLSTNPRKITAAQRKKLEASLLKFGLADIPVCDADGTVISGNQRLRAMLSLGWGDRAIDVRLPNRPLTDEERKGYTITANTHAGEWDIDALQVEYGDIDLGEYGLAHPAGYEPPDAETLFSDPGVKAVNRYAVVVECEGEAAQSEAFLRLTDAGYKCKILVV